MIEFSVDGSFFLYRSDIISAHIIITSQKKKIGLADFISSIVIPLQKAFTAELCGVLAIYKILEYYYRVLGIFKQVQYTIHSDYSSVLEFLSFRPKLITNSSKLH